MTSNPIIWSPDTNSVQESAMYRFMRRAGFDDYESLYQWSVDHSPLFWEAVCDFCDIRFDKKADVTLRRPDNIMDAGWFDGSQLNYAANLLRNDGDTAAIVFCGENGARRELSHRELRSQVATIASPVFCPTVPRPLLPCSRLPVSERSGLHARRTLE